MPDPNRRRTPSSAASPEKPDFELRHWRSLPSVPRRPPALDLRCPASFDGLVLSASGYISLRDLLMLPTSSAAMIQSPTADEIGISNRLVKHAAYAYLQPTPSCGFSSSSSSYSRRRCCRGLRRALGSCFGFIASFFRPIRGF